jgi:sugar phosphate isomerase/epimerase
MKLGFVSAILPDLSLEEVLAFAASTGYRCVEVMCWPAGKAERRYAGVTHIDCTSLDAAGAERIQKLVADTGVELSGLGYYPNPLTPDRAEAEVSINHLRRVISAARLLGLENVNTFIGRDWTKSVDDNWPRFREVWIPLIKFAEENGIRIGIENCPMSFTHHEWPGGKNLATSPRIWRRMFEEIPSPNFGLNFDPSHFVWQRMDYLTVLRDFADKMFHLHAKDARVDIDRLNDVGILAFPNEYHTPKLPGLGDVQWGPFFAVLGDIGYQGAICVEVEDRSFEGSLALRKASLVQSFHYLRQFVTDQTQYA